MPSLPDAIVPLLSPFASLFDARTWRKAQQLLMGAVLAPGRRTVCACLRVLGRQAEPDFALYHQVLNRARWSALAASRRLLALLLRHLDPGGPLVFGLDETIERRAGPRIEAKGVYRDAVRSSHSHFVKAMGLRWLSLMWLVPIPWAGRVWALPFLTVLAPSARYHAERGRRHKTLTDWARQMLCVLRRWLPDRELVVVGDQAYATLRLLAACQRWALVAVVRLRLDAALYAPPPPRTPGQTGRPRLKGARLPSLRQRLADPQTTWRPLTVRWYDGRRQGLDYATGTALWYHSGQPVVPLRWVLLRDPAGARAPTALLCTDPQRGPHTMVAWFLRRWQVEVTFQAVRTHLGGETQRQWAAPAIARTTPVLLGLFSWVTVVAHVLLRGRPLVPRRAAWYPKTRPTFADALALVRLTLWTGSPPFSRSRPPPDRQKPPPLDPAQLWEFLCYTA